MNSTRSEPKRVALYARVSTKDQNTDNQLIDLRNQAAQRGWVIQGEYLDNGISGTKEYRPALNRLMDVARKRQVEVILVWRFDRFARSVKHLVLALDELRALSVDFVSHQENVDTTTPLGQAVFTIIAAMAALERDLIVERVKAGLRRARQQGKLLGRPCLNLDLSEILQLQVQGFSQSQIAKKLKVSKATVSRVLKSLR